jgi:hypothetical protein
MPKRILAWTASFLSCITEQQAQVRRISSLWPASPSLPNLKLFIPLISFSGYTAAGNACPRHLQAAYIEYQFSADCSRIPRQFE